MITSPRHRALVIAFASVLLTTACSTTVGPAGHPAGPPAPATAGFALLDPVAGEPAPAGTDLTFTGPAPDGAELSVADDEGAVVAGDFLPGRRAWRPGRALAYGTTYRVRLGSSPSTSFTTMARPARTVRTTSYLGDGRTVGVGMPLVLRFDQPIAVADRAAVQRRLSVRSTPAQPGAWSWISSTEIHFRPREYWEAGTAITYRAQLGGAPMGGGRYGRADLRVSITVGPKLELLVDNATKRLTVRRDDKVIRTVPVSLGKDSTPTSSGTTVIMEKKRDTVFDTTDEAGSAGYRIPVTFAQRITVSGQFFHVAKWSESDQGKRNVSHGCVNLSARDGAWLFAQTHIGDVVHVRGTSRPLEEGNGFTDWNFGWDHFVRGSALPVGPPATGTR